MEVGLRSWVTEERNHEDGFMYSFFVWWVAVTCVGSRAIYNHFHTVKVPSFFGDKAPEEIVTLAARVQRAVDNGLGEAHFASSKLWSYERHTTLEERWAPFGPEWERERWDAYLAGEIPSPWL